VVKLAYRGPHDYSEEQVVNMLSSARPDVLTIDTETVSLKDRRMIGIGMALNPREAVYFPTEPFVSPYLGLAWNLLSQDSIKVFFNALYDLYVMADYQTSLSPTGPCNIGDHRRPLVRDAGSMGQIQGLPQASQQDCTRRYLGWEIESIQDMLHKGENMLDVDTGGVAHKCMADTLASRRLYDCYGGERWWAPEGHTWHYKHDLSVWSDLSEPESYYVSQGMKDCFQVDMKLIPILMRMSHKGMEMRPRVVERLHNTNLEEMLEYEDICKDHGFEPSKRQQVGYVLAERGNHLPFTKKGRQLRTDKEILEGLRDPLATVILEWGERNTLHKMYLRKWQERMMQGDFRAHTKFKMELSTARFSSYDDNLQNIPGALREAFAPDDGVWSTVDASQIEYRCFVQRCQDPVLLQAYKDGSDIHATTQAALWPETSLDDKEARRKPKIFNFAMVYGYYDGVAKTLSRNTRLPVETCQVMVDQWRAKYPVAAAHLEAHVNDPLPPYVETLYGRRCRLPKVGEMGTTEHHATNCLHSFGPQADAHEIVKRAMLMIADMDLRLEVHDEIIVNGRVEFPLEEMSRICPNVYTPFNESIGPVWK
jgi:hypothetical protein